MNQDRFFTQKFCDRCHGSLSGGRIMSRFNTDCLCMECERKERERPDYQDAADAELEAVKRGNFNYQGTGNSGKDEHEYKN